MLIYKLPKDHKDEVEERINKYKEKIEKQKRVISRLEEFKTNYRQTRKYFNKCVEVLLNTEHVQEKVRKKYNTFINTGKKIYWETGRKIRENLRNIIAYYGNYCISEVYEKIVLEMKYNYQNDWTNLDVYFPKVIAEMIFEYTNDNWQINTELTVDNVIPIIIYKDMCENEAIYHIETKSEIIENLDIKQSKINTKIEYKKQTVIIKATIFFSTGTINIRFNDKLDKWTKCNTKLQKYREMLENTEAKKNDHEEDSVVIKFPNFEEVQFNNVEREIMKQMTKYEKNYRRCTEVNIIKYLFEEKRKITTNSKNGNYEEYVVFMLSNSEMYIDNINNKEANETSYLTFVARVEEVLELLKEFELIDKIIKMNIIKKEK